MCEGDYLVTREIIDSARDIREREREGMGRSGRDDKQRRLLKQKVVLDTHFFWNIRFYCASTG